MNDKSGFQISEHAPRYYENMVHRFMSPFVDRLVRAVVREGDAVLDVACGTGFAARAASVAAGPSGRVVGSDINSGMVAMAKSVPHREGCEIVWRQASALDLPFADGEFDAVTCQQGIQFFPDSSAGLREMARVAKPGGRLAATVWAARERSPYLDALLGMLVRHCHGDPTAIAGAYAQGGTDQVQGWFKSADIAPANIELIETVVQLPPVTEYVPEHLKALPPTSVGKFFDLSETAQGELILSVEEQLDEYRTDDGITVPFCAYLATTLI